MYVERVPGNPKISVLVGFLHTYRDVTVGMVDYDVLGLYTAVLAFQHE